MCSIYCEYIRLFAAATRMLLRFSGVLCFLALCLQVRFAAVINRVGRNCRLEIKKHVVSYTCGPIGHCRYYCRRTTVFMRNVVLPVNYRPNAIRCYFPCGPIGHPRADSRSFLCGYQPPQLLPVNYHLNAKSWYFPCGPIGHYRPVKLLVSLH